MAIDEYNYLDNENSDDFVNVNNINLPEENEDYIEDNWWDDVFENPYDDNDEWYNYNFDDEE
jgi:hypothetical protein